LNLFPFNSEENILVSPSTLDSLSSIPSGDMSSSLGSNTSSITWTTPLSATAASHSLISELST